MRILVLGAAGMVGRQLIEAIIADDTRLGDKVTEIDAFDVVKPAFDSQAGGITIESSAGNIADEATVRALVDKRPDMSFHLAAIVSGAAEAEFENGVYRPRLVFTSSIAVFGAPFEDPITDTFLSAPLTSYGAQKAIGELLLSDYSRKGFVDGVGIRLPTIVVRPGKPNKAASGFFSGIIREPLAGHEAILPVDDSVRHWVASPAAAVGFLLHAATMDTETLGARRCLTMPGLSITIGEMIEALREVAGDEAVALIRREPDATIEKIVAGWPRDFDASRASEVGFVADDNFADIIRAHIADEAARNAAA